MPDLRRCAAIHPQGGFHEHQIVTTETCEDSRNSGVVVLDECLTDPTHAEAPGLDALGLLRNPVDLELAPGIVPIHSSRLPPTLKLRMRPVRRYLERLFELQEYRSQPRALPIAGTTQEREKGAQRRQETGLEFQITHLIPAFARLKAAPDKLA
jgi:hypothetical protein